MIAAIINHLWQSTLFGVVAALLTLAFRRNRAAVRYGLWFAASVKFLLPFSLLMGLGRYVVWTPVASRVAAPAISFRMVQVAQPFSNPVRVLPIPATTSVDWVPLTLLTAWLCGLVAIALVRLRGWRRIRAAVRASTPIEIRATVEVRCSPGLLEPGVVGLFAPILLLPEGIAERLTPSQLEAVLGHELCHVRRGDNFTAGIHMIVEAVFWFHPLVWWIGARLVEERERACDEAVLSLGSEPHDYAEGILNVCRSYVESPLSCVAGVTGSNLKDRIRAILTGDTPTVLSFGRKLILAVAGMAALTVPIVIGVISTGHSRAQSTPNVVPKFESATITPCPAFQQRNVREMSPGRLQTGCTTVSRLIEQAYGLYGDGHYNPVSSMTVTGGPPWVDSDLYQIDAKAEGKPSQTMMNGPMLQGLLADRLQLKMHRETREVPVYTLTVASGGPKLEPFAGSCIPWDSDNPPADRDPEQMCGRAESTSNEISLDAANMTDLGMFLLVTLDRPVIDKTGIQGRFNFHLDVPTEELRHGARGVAALSNPMVRPPAMSSSYVSAVEAALQKAGLNLEPGTGPGEFLVIDRVDRPR